MKDNYVYVVEVDDVYYGPTSRKAFSTENLALKYIESMPDFNKFEPLDRLSASIPTLHYWRSYYEDAGDICHMTILKLNINNYI